MSTMRFWAKTDRLELHFPFLDRGLKAEFYGAFSGMKIFFQNLNIFDTMRFYWKQPFWRINELVNPHLHFCILKHRDQKYFREVSFWSAEYRNRAPKIPLIFNFKNFGEFQKLENIAKVGTIKINLKISNRIFCLQRLVVMQHGPCYIVSKYMCVLKHPVADG